MIVGNLSSIEVVDNIIVNVGATVDVTDSRDILIEEAKEHERFAGVQPLVGEVGTIGLDGIGALVVEESECSAAVATQCQYTTPVGIALIYLHAIASLSS